jgi:DNA topoisomerase-3
VILIIAEKPSVAADIARVVGATDQGATHWEGNDHLVSWAVGHLLEFLPPEGYDEKLKRWRLKDLPILPDAFQLTPVRRTSKQLTALKRLIKRKDVAKVVNACDAGREGELIFREIFRHAGAKKDVDRLWLQSMTPAAIKDALANPRAMSEVQGLADAADCRAESDWIIGMNATRGLTARLRSARERGVWSAGRVQTPTLAILVKREREILQHVPEPYWIVRGTFHVDAGTPHDYVGTWRDSDAQGAKDRIFDPAIRDRVVALMEGQPLGAATEERKDRREVAPPLFDLTSLQREGNSRFGFPARRTLQAAQALYERHKLLTYPRTDSRALPSDYRGHVQGALSFLAKVPEHAPHAQRLLADGLQNQKRNFDDKAVSDHFAIIPTGAGNPSAVSGDEAKIFDLVVRRFLASFHPPAVFSEVERITAVDGESFRTSKRVLKELGWRIVMDRKAKAEEPELPGLRDSSAASAPAAGTPAQVIGHETEEKETKPPARLTEAGLLRLMETAGKEVDDAHLSKILKETGGLGTPATRADHIERVLEREYGERIRTLEGRGALRATARGIRLIDALERIPIPRLASASLTAELEDKLRRIERQEEVTRDGFMAEMRDWTKEIVDSVRTFQHDTLFDEEPPLGPCPLCKTPVRESLRAFGCEEGGKEGTCNFLIWKEIGGRHIDRVTAKELIETGTSPVKHGFFSRAGREFEAALRVNKEGRAELRLADQVMEAADGAPTEEIGACPFHPERKLLKTSAGFRCDGYEDGECRLNIPLILNERPLSVEEVQALTGEARRTAVLAGFTSRRGRPFSATLILKDDARIDREFPARDGSGAAGGGREFEVNPEPLGPCRDHAEAKAVETSTTYECNDSGCPNRLPREVCKREMSREEGAAYLAKGETDVLDGFISKKGKEFRASLYLKKNGRHGFRFPDKR